MKYVWIILSVFILCSITFSQESLADLFEPEEIVEDIDFLLKSLNDIHPTFNQYLSNPDYQNNLESIKKTITQPMSKYDFFKLMQPLISVDGHTSLRFDGEIYPKKEAPFFPFKILIRNNQIYVKENLSANPNIQKGMIIESINGQQSSTIINLLSKYIPHDGATTHPEKIAGVFHTFYQLIYGNFSEFNLTIRNGEKRENVIVNGIKSEDFTSETKPPFDFQILDNNAAYFYIEGFRQPDLFMVNIDSIFTILQEKNIKYLIIDKRSGGGFTNLADSLLSYLTNKSYKQFEKKVVKISSANRDYIDENKSNGLISDGYLTIEYGPAIPVKRNQLFNGKTYILMGWETYSAATYFVSAIKCNQIATLIGGEAGQPLISNGDIQGINLPNTKMICYSSMSTYYFPCAENRDESVKPDYEVKLSLEDLLNDTDRYLEHAIKLIDRDRVANKTE
ncbi:hypothetical protein JW824_07200 [bacterium]|nr:hypothetical protein [bacterium]RQV95284.1 MAG: hypothetical protein EH221_06490 [bacterium]